MKTLEVLTWFSSPSLACAAIDFGATCPGAGGPDADPPWAANPPSFGVAMALFVSREQETANDTRLI